MVKVKMVNISLAAMAKSKLNQQALEFYINYAKVEPRADWQFSYYLPEGMTKEMYDQLKAEGKTDEIKAYDNADPYFADTSIDLEWDDYFEIASNKVIRNLCKINRTYTIKIKDTSDGTAALELLSHKIELLDTFMKRAAGAAAQNYNIKCGVPLVDTALMSINRIKIMENCCSDELQKTLNEGYRILSVCPQPDQRRPDYVLGLILDKDSDYISDTAER